MNRGSIFSYPQYDRTIVLGLFYRNEIFIRTTSNNENNNKNKYNRLHIKKSLSNISNKVCIINASIVILLVYIKSVDYIVCPFLLSNVSYKTAMLSSSLSFDHYL